MTETAAPGTIDKRLSEIGVVLPRAPKAIGNYVPGVIVGNLLFMSGTAGTQPGDNDDDILPIAGKLGAELTVEQGYQSARLMALNHLASMKVVLGGDLDRVKRIVRMVGYVNAAPGFTTPHLVLNGASDLYVEIFGPERGRHARIALTQHELGLNAPVEAELTVELHR